jgi:hypothetical protein
MRLFIPLLVILIFCSTYGQVYKVQDKDSLNKQVLYDSLPMMCDSFYAMFIQEKLSGLTDFVPDVKYLKATFDTMDIAYRYEQVVYRQQLLLRNLQKDYKKILKRCERNKIALHKLEVERTEYDYGKDEKGNRYCYITVHCKRRKNTYELKYLAIRLNGTWFVGDDLKFEKIE